MKTAKKKQKKLLKYKNLSKDKQNSKKKRKSRIQFGCNKQHLGGENKETLSSKHLEAKKNYVNQKLKTKKIVINNKQKKVGHMGRKYRQNKTIKNILGESDEKIRDCKLRRGPPRLKLGIRNWAFRRPRHIINGCHAY